MTIDELLKKVNDGWGWATIELSRNGKDGKWSAFLQCVEVHEGDREVEQQFITADRASDALRDLVAWLRGKSVRHRGTNGGAPGNLIRIPKDLQDIKLS